MNTPTANDRRRRAAPWASRRLRAGAAVCTVAALVVGLGTGWGSVPLHVVALLAVVVAAAELVVLPARLASSRWPASLTEGAVGACLLVGEGAWSVVAVGVGVAAAQTVRRCPRRKRELDLAVRLLATALAQAACGAVGGGLGGALTGLAVFWLVSGALLAWAVSAVSDRPLPSLVLWIGRWSAVHTAGSAGVGLLAAWLALRAPLGLLGLALAAAFVRSAYASAAWRRGEARLFAHLAQQQRRTPEASAQLLVTAAARLLGGADVELVVLDAELPLRFTGDERGLTARSSEPVPLDEPWILQALTTPGVCVGRDDDRPTLTTALRRPGRPRAVLRVRGAVGGPDFDRQDLRSVEVLVDRADTWLFPRPDAAATAGHVPERPAGQPAVARVRASVERLDALAARGAALAEVAAELHELERAVASLLGTAGLPSAAVPQQRSGATEWTTTGVVR